MLPTTGPLPWVITISFPAAASSATWFMVALVIAYCSR